MHSVLWSSWRQKPLGSSGSGSRAHRLSRDSFRDDLRKSAEPFAPASIAEVITSVRTTLGFAIHASVAFIPNSEFLLLGNALQALYLIGDLTTPKKRLEYEGISLGHDLGNLLLHKLSQFFLPNRSAKQFLW
jgi:hypothetical protein